MVVKLHFIIDDDSIYDNLKVLNDMLNISEEYDVHKVFEKIGINYPNSDDNFGDWDSYIDPNGENWVYELNIDNLTMKKINCFKQLVEKLNIDKDKITFSISVFLFNNLQYYDDNY